MIEPEQTEMKPHGHDDKTLARMLVWAALFIMLSYTVLISIRLSLAPMHSQGLLAIVGTYTILSLTMVLAWFQIRVRLVAHMMLIMLTQLIVYRAYVAGGTDSPVIIMSIMLPVSAMFLLGRVAGLTYAIINGIALLLFIIMRMRGYEFPDIELNGKVLGSLQSLVILFVMAVCTWVAWLYARHNERLTQSLLDQTRRDHLTGIPNRRAFDFALNREVKLAKRHGTELSLFMVDLDFFKSFNDLYGHHAGDQCLIAVANIIQSCLRRPGDMVARYGGEEFAVILPDTPLVQAKQLAETMRHAVLGLNIEHKDSTYGSVSITLGGSKLDLKQDMQPEELLRRSDEALYSGKEAGRNQVVIIEND